MQKLIALLDRFNGISTRWAGYAATLLLATMLGIMVTHVFFRYVLNDSFGWTEELARYMMVWMAFLFFPAAHRQGLNASLEIATNWFKNSSPWRLLQLLLEICVLAVLIWCMKLGFERVERGATSVSLSLGISMSYIYLVLPLSFALTSLSSLERVLRLSYGLFAPNALLYTQDRPSADSNTEV
ncbi:TRAP transporter small permease [Halomonas sp. TD01]|uniref:TRAP transporter small permease n=1 Tax=Halomonas sp. TD01 TaxID=999141 RepID=UPI000214D659|nr:TRAP transporter small permease [Halomonas sp. TD01]EGP18246.1 tripartite ATP-independent periplasmic transporter DctQ [Halomonas sp. TD01]CAH1044407.1 Tripartite ATP-independent periplasmic transporter, DctQ component [Halomonas sp. TD01]